MHHHHKLNIDSNRNIKNIKIAVKNANLCGKDMPYAHFAEICGNLRNMRQSHICIKLTCLTICPTSYNISAYMNNYVNVQQGRGILRMTCSRLLVWPLYDSTCVDWYLGQEMEDFLTARFTVCMPMPNNNKHICIDRQIAKLIYIVPIH